LVIVLVFCLAVVLRIIFSLWDSIRSDRTEEEAKGLEGLIIGIGVVIYVIWRFW